MGNTVKAIVVPNTKIKLLFDFIGSSPVVCDRLRSLRD
jgi:hypothetical protein